MAFLFQLLSIPFCIKKLNISKKIICFKNYVKLFENYCSYFGEMTLIKTWDSEISIRYLICIKITYFSCFNNFNYILAKRFLIKKSIIFNRFWEFQLKMLKLYQQKRVIKLFKRLPIFRFFYSSMSSSHLLRLKKSQ